MHSYYRSRLAAAFLPEVNTGGPHLDADSHPMMFRLVDVSAASGTPYHIINTTLNTTSSKNATYRARNGESFSLWDASRGRWQRSANRFPPPARARLAHTS